MSEMITFVSREDMTRLSTFLKRVPGLTVLASDSPSEGKRGFVAYFTENEEEISLKMEYQEYKKPDVIHDITDENIDEVLDDIDIDRVIVDSDMDDLQEVIKTMKMVDIVGEEYPGQYDPEREILRKHGLLNED
jgi:hypothetical protein